MMDPKEFGEYLKECRTKSGYPSQRKFAEISGISNGTIARIEKGTQYPKPETLEILAKYFKGVTYEELMNKAGYIEFREFRNKLVHRGLDTFLDNKDKDKFFEEASSLLVGMLINMMRTEESDEDYKKLDNLAAELKAIGVEHIFLDPIAFKQHNIDNLEENQKFAFLLHLVSIISRYQEVNFFSNLYNPRDNFYEVKEPTELVERYNGIRLKDKVESTLLVLKVPVLGQITAGLPILAQEHIEEWTEIPNMWKLKEGEVFVLRVKGDSMIGSRIHEGDRVIVKIQPEVESGEIAVVNVNGSDATLKKVKKTESGQTILYPDNPKYEPIFIDNENARIVGKVIQVMFDPNSK